MYYPRLLGYYIYLINLEIIIHNYIKVIKPRQSHQIYSKKYSWYWSMYYKVPNKPGGIFACFSLSNIRTDDVLGTIIHFYFELYHQARLLRVCNGTNIQFEVSKIACSPPFLTYSTDERLLSYRSRQSGTFIWVRYDYYLLPLSDPALLLKSDTGTIILCVYIAAGTIIRGGTFIWYFTVKDFPRIPRC